MTSESEQLREGSGVEASGEESAGEMTWTKPSFDAENSNSKLQNYRIPRKKRTHYNSISHAGVSGLTLASSSTPSVAVDLLMSTRVPYGKNSRKSRSGFRQISKKGLFAYLLMCETLASDKDVWIRVSDEMDELELDYNDPDYDSEEEVFPIVSLYFLILESCHHRDC